MKGKPLTVCLVSHTAGAGGAERSLRETVRALRGRGVDCVVLLPGHGWLETALAGDGVECRILPYKKWSASAGGPRWRRLARSVWNLALAPRAALWIRGRGVDVVYTNVITTGFGALAAALSGRPHVWHIRELGYVHHGTVYDLGESLTLGIVRSLSRLCVANSETVARHYRERLRPTEIRVVYQAVGLDPADPASVPAKGAGFRCVVVGSLHAAKHPDEAVHALARLEQSGLDAELLVAGQGEAAYERELRGLVERLGLAPRVRFLGALDSASAVIASADAVVTCSRNEAFGRVTVEGMLAGKPVVGARSAGTAELVRDGETGFLYEPGDVERLAGILRELIEDPQRGRRVGQRARAWAGRRFTEQRFADEMLACLLPPA